MKKTFLFLAALAMSAMMWAETATYTKVTSNPTDWSGDYILVYEVDGAARVFTGVDAANDFVEATISDNTITGEFVTLTLETTDGGYLVKINGGDNDGKYISHSANSNGLSTGTSGAVMTMSYDESVLMTNAGGAVMRYNSASNQNRFRFYKATSYTGQQPVQLYKAGSTPTPATLEGIVIKGEASKLEYFVGDSFDPAGLEVWGIYTKTVKGDSTSQIKSGITWTCDPEVFALGNTSVNVTATYKDKTSAPFTVNNIVVKEKVVPTGYAGVYTSNVEYGGSDTVIYDKVKYSAKKMAKNTPATITVPAHTKNLHIHAAAWNKEGNEWTISGLTKDVKIKVIADAGVAGTGFVFTLQNDPATNDYFAIETNNDAALTLTITLPKDKRGVIFGINAEMQEGVVAAPAFTPTVADFDTEVEVTLTADEGAVIYYTLDGTTPTDASTKYESAFTLTATTTIKAIAVKDGKSSEVAEKTYNLVPVYTLAELVAAGAPTAEGTKVVLVLENAEITELDAKSEDQGGDVRGLSFMSGEQKVVLYQQQYAFPKEWAVGGKVSGRVMGDWVLWYNTWELKIATEEIDKLSYTAPVQTAKLESITLSLDKETLYQNEEFKYSGTVTANYDDQSTKDVTDQVTYKGYDMAVLGEQTVTVSYTEGEITKEATYTLTVVEKVAPTGYASIYTSNVELTTEGGTSASAAKVVVAVGDTVSAIKCGTTSTAGVCVLTIPAGTQTLHFHAVGWKDKNVTLDVNGTEYTLVADAGITNNSPFTLKGTASDYYYAFDPNGATTVTFTATSDKRFVIFGVNAEMQEGVVAAPSFTPTATDFDTEVEVTLTADEGAVIYYTLDGTTPTDASTKYESAFTLTATTTIKAIAVKDGKSSEVAEKTYNLVPVYTLAELVAAGAPTAEGTKVVLVLENAEITELDAKSEDQGGGVRGLSFMSGEQKVVLFQQQYAFPKEWAVGGKVSGRVMGDWVLWSATWELKIATEEIGKLSYTAPGPVTGLQQVMQNANIRKAMHNGRIMILKGDKMFNLQGMLVK